MEYEFIRSDPNQAGPYKSADSGILMGDSEKVIEARHILSSAAGLACLSEVKPTQPSPDDWRNTRYMFGSGKFYKAEDIILTCGERK